MKPVSYSDIQSALTQWERLRREMRESAEELDHSYVYAMICDLRRLRDRMRVFQ